MYYKRMRFTLLAKLKHSALYVLLFAVLLSSVLGTLLLFAQPQAIAEHGPLTLKGDFDYRYVVENNQLYIYAYMKEGTPEGQDRKRAIGWESLRSVQRARDPKSDAVQCTFNPILLNNQDVLSDHENIYLTAGENATGRTTRIQFTNELPHLEVCGNDARDTARAHGWAAGDFNIEIERPENYLGYEAAFSQCISSPAGADNNCMSLRLPAAIEAAAAAAADTQPSCESEGGEMSWLLCPVLRMMDGIINWSEDQVNNLLEFPNEYLEPPAVSGLERAWGRIRNIAYLILLPIMLIMVMGTALGFEVVSAYTLKRALPRLVIATIFIATSFTLMKELVIFSNNLAVGASGLITSAVDEGSEIKLAGLFDPSPSEGFLFTLALGPGLLAAAVALPLILGYAAGALVSLLLAFFVLAMRQALIIGLILVSPLAILSWIFPGNDKLWKLWWSFFSKLLFLYPVYQIILGSADAFSALVRSL